MDKVTSRVTESLEGAAREMQSLWGEKAEHVATRRAEWADQLGLTGSAATWRAVADAVRTLTMRGGSAR